MTRKYTTRDRFEERVDRSPGQGPDGTCHQWIGPKRNGYVAYSRMRGGKQEGGPAHREALRRAGVTVPDDMMVLHSCDNPSCCTPAHLRVGTAKDNAEDASARNRWAKERPTCRIDAAAELRLYELLWEKNI